jgi:hypothetical protein
MHTLDIDTLATYENHLAHLYVDTAHRAALLYSFATAAMVLVIFFVFAIVGLTSCTASAGFVAGQLF